MTTPITGDPTALRRAAGSIEAAAADLATHRGDSRRVRHAALAQWDGSASMAFGGTMATYGMDVDRNASALRALAGAVRTFADDLERHQGEDRTLRKQLLGADHHVRVLRREQRIAADPVTAAQTDNDLRDALSRVRTTRSAHDALWTRHRRSLVTFRAALDRTNPPERLWHEGARRIGLAKTTVTALGKGKAVITVVRLERKPVLTEKQATKHAAATRKLQRGILGGLADKKWVNKLSGGAVEKGLALAGPAANLYFLYESVKPGWKDLRTGGGYTGWRDVGTRVAGIAQMSGVVLVRFPYTRVAGATAIGAWIVWKSANSIHDNDDWINKELPKVINDQIDQNVPAAPALRAAARKVGSLGPYYGRAEIDPALRRKIAELPPPQPAPYNPVFHPDIRGFTRSMQYGPPAPMSPWVHERRRQVVTP